MSTKDPAQENELHVIRWRILNFHERVNHVGFGVRFHESGKLVSTNSKCLPGFAVFKLQNCIIFVWTKL
jgi:hypothetical protein